MGQDSFKALGGAYAVIALTVEAASRRLGRTIDLQHWRDPEVATAAGRNFTFACATAGNYTVAAVARGAQLVGRCGAFELRFPAT